MVIIVVTQPQQIAARYRRAMLFQTQTTQKDIQGTCRGVPDVACPI